jgi:hypothetical protein
LAIFNPGPPTVITATNGIGGRGRNNQKKASNAIAANTADEMTTARARRGRGGPDDELKSGA